MSLDCIGDRCGDDDYERGGYSRWSFFEYLDERFGSTIVKDVLDRGAALGDPTACDHRSSRTCSRPRARKRLHRLDDRQPHGDYTAPGLKGVLPRAYSQMARRRHRALCRHVAVNHLAARYLVFRRGDGSDGACYSADLSLHVTIPAGSSAKPYFYWPAVGATPQPLAISGNEASITVPWDTCAWPYGGYLVLQNPSATLDAHVFTVTGSVTVDRDQAGLGGRAAPTGDDLGPGRPGSRRPTPRRL